jgi:hypothetical protein
MLTELYQSWKSQKKRIKFPQELLVKNRVAFVLKCNAMNTYRGAEVKLHTFITSAVDTNQGLVTRFGCFMLIQKLPASNELEVGWAPRAGLDVNKIPDLPEIKPWSPSPQSQFTD